MDSQTSGIYRICQEEQTVSLPYAAYPLDMSFALALSSEVLGADRVPYRRKQGPQPGTVTLYALAQWNIFLTTAEEEARRAFLAQAYWLLQHARLLKSGGAGWPVLPSEGSPALSALVQGGALSVLLRAYLLTQDRAFLQLLLLVFKTFQLDILDGGIAAPVLLQGQEQGLWFEEVACYPAGHMLQGMLYALVGLHEYAYLNRNGAQNQATSLFQRAFATLHVLIPEFDRGYWVRQNLWERRLLTAEQLKRAIQLLQALTQMTGDGHCTYLVRHWSSYLQAAPERLQASAVRFFQRQQGRPMNVFRAIVFPHFSPSSCATKGELRISVPMTAFPPARGIRITLEKMHLILCSSGWRLSYLAWSVGKSMEGYEIERFGSHWLTPRHFPFVWAYVLAGGWKLAAQLRQGASYDLILPQDAVFTAAFAAPLAHLAGIRVVCVDHGNLIALSNQMHRQERLENSTSRCWLRLRLEPWLLRAYWPSLQMLAWIAARFVDHYLIPGVPGDGIEEVCYQLGIPASRLTRFVNTINVEQFVQRTMSEREILRLQRGLAADAVVITTISRLSPGKGLEVAFLALDQALSRLVPELRTRVRFVIAGEGQLRSQLEALIHQRGLDLTCVFWGEISQSEAVLLHELSDVYVYTGALGDGYSLAILEAMAAASAVLAPDVPQANVRLLADERGVVVPADDVASTAQALVHLIEDEAFRARLGRRARTYIAQENTEQAFRCVWQRATYWSGLDELMLGYVVDRQEGI